jgi:hypothetical protein
MSTPSQFDAFVRRARARYRENLDLGEIESLDPSIRWHYGTERVEVTRTREGSDPWVRRGRIGATTGWRPALILLSRSSAIGSADVLTPEDRVTAVITNGKRRPL